MAFLRRLDESLLKRLLDWLFEPKAPKGRVGKHRTPDGMLSTAQVIAQFQARMRSA